MTPEDLRRLTSYLQEKIELEENAKLRFEIPDEPTMVSDGMHPDGVRQLIDAPWLSEMIADVIETPDFCEPGDPPEQVLAFARDVVQEYIWKRFEL
jgi:hypothetical protein